MSFPLVPMHANMSTLIHFLLAHGWDYSLVPKALGHLSERSLRRLWQKRMLPEYVTSTDEVVLALLEVDPPAKCKKRKLENAYGK
jgi:hypothetical protein